MLLCWYKLRLNIGTKLWVSFEVSRRISVNILSDDIFSSHFSCLIPIRHFICSYLSFVENVWGDIRQGFPWEFLFFRMYVLAPSFLALGLWFLPTTCRITSLRLLTLEAVLHFCSKQPVPSGPLFVTALSFDFVVYSQNYQLITCLYLLALVDIVSKACFTSCVLCVILSVLLWRKILCN